MNKLSKISAIVLVVAMMLTMVSVTVSAEPQFQSVPTFTFEITDESGNEVEEVDAGTKVYVAAYATPQTYDAFTYNVDCGGEVIKDEITSTATDITVTDKNVNINWTAAFTVTADTPIATIPIIVPEDASGEFVLITPKDIVYSIYSDFAFGTTVTDDVDVVKIVVAGQDDTQTSIVKNEITDDGKWELEWTKPSQEAVAIIAYYDGTTMLCAELIAIADKIDGETGMCSFISDELKYDGATMVRCYLFDKLNGLHPITNVIEEIYL